MFDFSTSNNNYLLADFEAYLDPDKVNNKQYLLSNCSAAIFTLDIRTNRDPYQMKNDTNTIISNYFLGEEQWTW